MKHVAHKPKHKGQVMFDNHASDRRKGMASRRLRRSRHKNSSQGGHKKGLSSNDHSINFTRARGSFESSGNGPKPRIFALAGAALLILIVLALVVSSCVRGCSRSQQETTESSEPVNSVDERVSAEASEALTKEFTTELDRCEKLAWIAKHLDKYSDDRLIELALNEPAAIKFVAGVPKASGTTKAYTKTVKKGSYPKLYCFDTKWGYAAYGDGLLGVTGSGPTTLAMAYMGLKGTNDKSPADFAELSTQGGYDSGSSGTATNFFASVGGGVGLDVTEQTADADTLHAILEAGQIAIVELKANSVTDYAHWALVIALNEDDSVTLYDPTSAVASSHTWSYGTIGSSSKTMLSVVVEGEDTSISTSSDSDSSYYSYY